MEFFLIDKHQNSSIEKWSLSGNPTIYRMYTEEPKGLYKKHMAMRLFILNHVAFKETF